MRVARKPYRKPSASPVTVRSLNGSTMSTYDSIDKRQAEAMATRVSPFDATLEDMRPDLRIETGPVVFNDERRGILARAERNCHRA